jgi:hypothetical protein
MTDVGQVEAAAGFGRNQKWAAVGYAIPFATVALPALASMGKAIIASDTATQLAVIDRLSSFATTYGLVAVGLVLGIAGAIKGIGSIAEAIAAKAAR